MLCMNIIQGGLFTNESGNQLLQESSFTAQASHWQLFIAEIWGQKTSLVAVVVANDVDDVGDIVGGPNNLSINHFSPVVDLFLCPPIFLFLWPFSNHFIHFIHLCSKHPINTFSDYSSRAETGTQPSSKAGSKDKLTVISPVSNTTQAQILAKPKSLLPGSLRLKICV